MVEIFKAAHAHKGTSFVEVFQNCVIFNNNAFDTVTGREVRSEQSLMLEDGQPLRFGENKGIRLNGFDPEIVELGNGVEESDLLVHKSKTTNPAYASILAQMAYPAFPTPFGILRQIEGRETYEDALHQQIKSAQSQGEGNLQELLTGKNSWVVE